MTIKSDIELTARNLREHNTAMHEMLKTAIREVDDKVMKMLRDLSERADLTNGNVKSIRLEIDSVKRDVESVWDRLQDTDEALGTEAKMSDTSARNRRQREFERRRKRQEIQDTSENQDLMNKRYDEGRRR